MKIVNRTAFLALPAGTLYSKYEQFVFGDLSIKGDSIGGFDFYEQDIASSIAHVDTATFVGELEHAQTTGESLKMDLHFEGRDGLFNKCQLFAVWERADVEQLIARLQETLK